MSGAGRSSPALLAGLAMALLAGCTQAPVGSRERPLRMFFVPSVDAGVIAVNAKELTSFVQRHMSRALYGSDEGFFVEASIPASYIAVIEAFGTARADFAALNTFSYVLARDVKGLPLEPIVSVVRGEGERTYRGQIIARRDRGIASLEDLAGKRFAFTDPASTAGYVLPAHLFEQRGIVLGQTVFAMKHDNVVTQVYQGQVDPGATFYSPPRRELRDGREVEVVRDARARVLTQYPDVVEQVAIVGFTMETPNEPWVLRSNLYPDAAQHERVKRALTEALMAFAATAEGRRSLNDLYDITGLAPVEDAVYAPIRALILSKVDLEAVVE